MNWQCEECKQEFDTTGTSFNGYRVCMSCYWVLENVFTPRYIGHDLVEAERTNKMIADNQLYSKFKQEYPKTEDWENPTAAALLTKKEAFLAKVKNDSEFAQKWGHNGTAYKLQNKTQEYVAGALFNEDKTRLGVVKKIKPSWQANKLNLIGGKIESGETPIQAMIREFKEEAGADVTDWRQFCELRGANGEWVVYFFVAFGNFELTKMEEEDIMWVQVADIHNLPVLPNLHWLIPLALDECQLSAVVYDPVNQS